MKNKSKKIQLSLLLVSLLSANAYAQSYQENTSILKNAGINVVNGFNMPGSAERVNTIRGDREVRSAGNVPENSTVQTSNVSKDEQETTTQSSATLQQYQSLNSALGNVNQSGRQALENLKAQNGISTNSDMNAISQPQQNSSQKRNYTPSQKIKGPNIQSVDITHFNKETLKEMEAYGNQKQSEEYLKFRINASQHKNPPITIKNP